MKYLTVKNFSNRERPDLTLYPFRSARKNTFLMNWFSKET